MTPEIIGAEERLALFVDGVKEYAIFLIDPEGRVVSWNAGAERIKGYRQEEILGRSHEVFYPPEEVAAGRPDRLLEAAARDGRVADEGWRVRKDGSRFWANVLITALYSDGGDVLGFAKITRDETERRAAAEQRRQLALAAERERIGEEMRNTVIHRVFSAALELQSALPLVDSGEVRARVEAAVAEMDRTIQQLREAIVDLHEG